MLNGCKHTVPLCICLHLHTILLHAVSACCVGFVLYEHSSLSCYTSWVSIELWLHCLGLCSCYTHWLISRILFHCNMTASRTSSTLLIYTEAQLWIWNGIVGGHEIPFPLQVVGTFHSLRDWGQLLTSMHTYTYDITWATSDWLIMHAVKIKSYIFTVGLKDMH